MPIDELMQLDSFRSDVPSAGYGWEFATQLEKVIITKPGNRKPERFLIETSPGGEYSPSPLNDTLFFEFAEVPLTREGVRAFANQYGLLGVPELVSSDKFLPPSAASGKIPARLGESQKRWAQEIKDMHRLVRLWNPAFRKKRGSRFEDNVLLIPPNRIEYECITDYGKRKEVITEDGVRSWLQSPPPDLKEQIRRRSLLGAVNEKLKHSDVRIALYEDPSKKRSRLRIIPTSLKDFLWLQFAKAINRGTVYRECLDCGSWFPLGDQGGRSDKRFCSGTCKSRTHRRQK
jgi:hypothetical protein